MSINKRVMLYVAIGLAAVIVVGSVIIIGSRNAVPSPAELLSLGEKYLTELDYEQALVQFMKVIEIEPMNERAYLGAAEAYIALGQANEAIALLERGLEALPSNSALQAMLEELRPPKEPEVESMAPIVTENPALTTHELYPDEIAMLDLLTASLEAEDKEQVRELMARSEFHALLQRAPAVPNSTNNWREFDYLDENGKLLHASLHNTTGIDGIDNYSTDIVFGNMENGSVYLSVGHNEPFDPAQALGRSLEYVWTRAVIQNRTANGPFETWLYGTGDGPYGGTYSCERGNAVNNYYEGEILYEDYRGTEVVYRTRSFYVGGVIQPLGTSEFGDVLYAEILIDADYPEFVGQLTYEIPVDSDELIEPKQVIW